MGHMRRAIAFKKPHLSYRVFDLAPSPSDLHRFAPPAHFE
jgi:hypothetical protein